ncbi:cilia- and flagella-associated protein 46 isoform X1 [Silurus meridionalis]|uniref:cilia- and flagella-associated protein 46 isoform X1 n=1 Tax=Silurus meridionalis TaxID=175797 RepID=UPI001EE9CE4A|nr:cilia- and flagella-associated protein 46 isoform X1 [Silurus meridionalis]XP_046691482.1 cilia- and flagella-associated protein 46 isoform X1 [Silurus meridionalis]
MDLRIRQYLTQAQDKDGTNEYPAALRRAYATIKDAMSGKAASDPQCFLPELYVLCAEQALVLGCREITEDCLMMYLESKPPPNQFLCRAYFCQAQLNSPRTVASVEDMDRAVTYYLKAIEISKDKPRYHFLVFNASVLYLQTVRAFLRPCWRRYLVSSLTQVLSALEEVAEPDYIWRAELMMLLVKCLVDAGKKNDAADFSKVTSKFIQQHTPELYPQIFSIQVQHDLIDVSNILTKARPQLLAIYKLQKLKKLTVNAGRKEPDELREIFVLLTHKSQSQSSASNSHSIDTDDSRCMTVSSRIDLLLQLAFLSLHFKEQIIAEECIKELKNIDETAVGKHIMVECVECELVLMKQNSNIEDYTKSSVETQLRIVTRLEALLLRAVREGDAQVTQSVCAALWNSCLPLLQHNLRKNIKSPLLTLSKALEDINSMLLDMRCQVHAELAAIEEEAERLEPAIQHLHAALGLDENGQFHQRLSFSLHCLQLRSKLYSTPTRPEDQAAMLIQQTKEHLGNEPAKNWRPILVSAGIALAPDTFQMVLDADSTAKGSGRLDTVEQLAAKAKHYRTCVQKVECHFANLERDTDDRERIRLWASLVKAARKQVLWDVCRAACRFCLLYDDKRWKIERQQMYKEESGERELLRLLAEVHFINAEATIHKLRSEGVELNDSPVPPVKRGMLTLDDPQWTLYSDWIQEMSDYATTNLLRGAELGAELQEPWLVVNAAVYLWNYNSHILAAKRQNKLVTTFSQLVELLRQTGHEREVVLLVLLCDAVAQGIIKPWCGTSGHTTQQREYFQSQADKTKTSGKKGMEKSGSTHSIQLEAAVVQDIKKALQMCDYALRLSNGNDETVPIMVRKQLISTWVNTKRLLQQQIGQNLDIDDECKNEAVRAMSRVLVGVEMMRCNTNHGLMEFSVPSLTMLIQMASDCKWSDPVVELYAWSQLARFAHRNADHDLVMTCTQNSLQLDQKAKNKAKISVLNLYSIRMVQEMLSTAACLRGLSMLHKSCGHFAKYTEALAMLHTSISYAEQAGSWPLCRTAAKHYWNSCLALINTPEQRQQLQKPLELIVKALTRTYSQPTGVKNRRPSAQKQKQPGALDSNTEDDLAVRAAMYSLIFQVHVDCGSLRNGLQVLDLAIREMPHSPHRLTLYKQRVLVKAQLGESIELDMHMFTELEEVPCAMMWHHVALATNDIQQKMHCYQNAINKLQSAESQWKKVDLLLEYAEWLYCNNFPVTDVQLQTQSAIDILLSSGLDSSQSDSNRGNPETPVQADVAVPVSGPQAPTSMLPHTKLNDVHTLDMLVQAYTLLAIIESRVSTKHLQYLVEAYHCVVKIWQVSMKTAQEVIKDVLKNSDIAPQPVLADSSKKDKEKEKEHEKIFKSKEKKPKVPGLDASFQLNPEKWAQFECPEEFRQAFKHDHSISMQNRTLFYLDLLVKELESVSLTLLTLPPLHLAEVIAHDLLLSKSHSDLYRLRILKTCCELGLDSSSPYNDALLSFAHISEDEQMLCRKTVALKRERTGPHTEAQVNKTQETAPLHSGCGVSEGSMCRKRLSECTMQNLLMDKAAVCISMGLYQPARRLLAEVHLVAKELGDKTILARCFYLLAVLASHEQQHGQALALVEQAQEIGGDEDFWYNLILSLLNTTVQIDGDNIYTQVCKITDTAIGLFRSALEQKPNRASVLNFYIASLQARGAVLCRQSLRVTCPGHSVSADTVKKLNAVCDTLEKSAAALRQHGYKNQAAETILEQAHTLRMLAMVTSIKEEKQQHLLDALSLIQQAVALQEEVLSDCLRLIPTQEGGWRRLPAMRVSVRFRLALADLGLLMLEMFCEEEKVKATIQIRMSSTERAVDSYLKSSPELNALQREWLTMGQSVGQLTFTQLSVVQSLIKDCVETRMQTLGMLGKCLRLLALQRDPLYPNSMWDKSFMVNIAGGKETECKDKDENVESSSLVEGSISQSDNTIKMNNKRAVQQMLVQASDTLTEALSLGLQQSLPELLSYVCEEMLESHSQNDTAALGQYLALLQSCVCCTEMSRVLDAACWDSSQSQVAALLGLQKSLKFSQHSHSRLLSATDHSLKTLSKAYQHVNINPKHLSLLGELPSNLKILLLQHSKDGSVLYGAFYEKAQSTESHKFKSMQIAGGLVCSKVTKAQVQPTGLLQLRHQTQAFRQLAAQTIIKESCRLRNAVQTKDCIQLKKNTDQELREHFQGVVKGMEDYLHPLLSQFDFSCFSRCPRSTVTDEATQPKDKEEREATDNALPEHGECVVVLADTMLLELPLEALRVLRGSGISSISRDFSLQVFHSRLHRDEQVESDSKTERKSAKTAKGKGDQSKAIKVAPVSRVLPADTLSVDSRKFKYFVDPHSDGVDNRSSPAETMRKILDMYSQQFTAQWEGVVGSKQPCRSQDLEHLLTNCSCFIYCGEDRFLNHISPDRFANLNLSECELAVIFDPVHNSQSMWLQSHWDIQKCKAHLALESPVECAYLLTLSGVHSIMLNQWSNITRANAHNMETIMEHLLQTGLTSGQAVHTLRKKASLAQKEPDYALEADDEPGWISPSAMNFIIYGLPNLIVT